MIGQERFDELVREHQVPGATLAVLAGDDLHTLASGVLNLGTGVEVTPDSMFQLASITKVYTEVARQVTMRHLLTHTSGIGGDFFRGDWRGDDCVERYVASCAAVGQDVPALAVMRQPQTAVPGPLVDHWA